MDAIDETKLAKSNGKPTAVGKALMFKSMAIIQLEMVYLITKWTNKVTGEFNKSPDHAHARDLCDYFPYLAEMDTDYLFRKTIEVTSVDGSVHQTEVARLYPMDRSKTYGKHRRRRKHYDFNVECENKFKMGPLNDETDEE